eukprot:TRINITY_DN14399_c1_g1_i1.p1 TRINITY_DN14399_c1_g1~~TRINITY_DN14399_c1_g1_i1.p1  ORF type:complete len:587 (-),score=84.02 TRINITY_DN14399_c1_g1_i1:695-2455(-)
MERQASHVTRSEASSSHASVLLPTAKSSPCPRPTKRPGTQVIKPSTAPLKKARRLEQDDLPASSASLQSTSSVTPSESAHRRPTPSNRYVESSNTDDREGAHCSPYPSIPQPRPRPAPSTYSSPCVPHQYHPPEKKPRKGEKVKGGPRLSGRHAAEVTAMLESSGGSMRWDFLLRRLGFSDNTPPSLFAEHFEVANGMVRLRSTNSHGTLRSGQSAASAVRDVSNKSSRLQEAQNEARTTLQKAAEVTERAASMGVHPAELLGLPKLFGHVKKERGADGCGYIKPDRAGPNIRCLPSWCTGFDGKLPPAGTRVTYFLGWDLASNDYRAMKVCPLDGSRHKKRTEEAKINNEAQANQGLPFSKTWAKTFEKYSRQLWVESLPESFTDHQLLDTIRVICLKNHIGSVQVVQDAVVVKSSQEGVSRRHGFVLLRSASDAKQIISFAESEPEHFEIDGEPFLVHARGCFDDSSGTRPTTSPSLKTWAKDSEKYGRQLRVENLPESITDRQLLDMFRLPCLQNPIGMVQDAVVVKKPQAGASRRHGFVLCVDEGDADRIISFAESEPEHFMIDGEPVLVNARRFFDDSSDE